MLTPAIERSDGSGYSIPIFRLPTQENYRKSTDVVDPPAAGRRTAGRSDRWRSTRPQTTAPTTIPLVSGGPTLPHDCDAARSLRGWALGARSRRLPAHRRRASGHATDRAKPRPLNRRQGGRRQRDYGRRRGGRQRRTLRPAGFEHRSESERTTASKTLVIRRSHRLCLHARGPVQFLGR